MSDSQPKITIFNAQTCAVVVTITNDVLNDQVRGLTYINSTTFAAVSSRKVVFFAWSTGAVLGWFDTGHTEDAKDMTYFESSFDKFVITASKDKKCKGTSFIRFFVLKTSLFFQNKVFKWSGTAWDLQLTFSSHNDDLYSVITLSTGRIASGGNDNRVRVWDYKTGSVTQNYDTGFDIRTMAQISSNLLAVGGSNNNIKIWCFTNNTEIKTINVFSNCQAIVAFTSTKITVGTNDEKTYIFDWVSGAYTVYQTNGDDVVGTAITSSKLVVSVGDGSSSSKVRNVTGLDISAGSDVCTRSYSNTARSVVAQSPNQLGKFF